MKITISFIGRQSDAIGSVYSIEDTYEVSSIDEFKSKFNMDYSYQRIHKIKGCTLKQLEQAKIVPVRHNRVRLRSLKTHLYVKPEQLIPTYNGDELHN